MPAFRRPGWAGFSELLGSEQNSEGRGQKSQGKGRVEGNRSRSRRCDILRNPGTGPKSLGWGQTKWSRRGRPKNKID